MMSKLAEMRASWRNGNERKYFYLGCMMILLIASVLFYYFGVKLANYNTQMLGVIFVWLANILFAKENINKRAVYLFFQITFWLFLISRPMIKMCRGEWWYTFLEPQETFAVRILFISQFALFAGAMIATAFSHFYEAAGTRFPNVFEKKVKKEFFWKKEEFIKILQLVAEITFYLSWVCYFALRVEEYLYTKETTYYMFYAYFESKIPYVVYVGSTFMKYSLCVFLATMPKKRRAFVPLAMYVLSTVPTFLMGMRNPFALSLIFVFLYYLIRDARVDVKKWLGKIEKGLVVVMAPVVIVLLGVFSSVRVGKDVVINSLKDTILNFFVEQGFSYDVLCWSHAMMPQLPNREMKNYTFGCFIDYFSHGIVAQKLFGATALPSVNSVELAVNGNSFAHAISYTCLGDQYLNGAGLGSSFLLETYADYGYVGAAIFSICLGAFLIWMMCNAGKGLFRTLFILLCMTSIFLMPRNSAFGWIEFILTAQCWVSLICIFGGSYFIYRLKDIKNRKKAEGNKENA